MRFVRKAPNDTFILPQQDDVDIVSAEDDILVLPLSTLDRRGSYLTFLVDFDGYNLQ